MSGESRQVRRGVAAFIVVHTPRRADRISTLVYMRLRSRSLHLSLSYHFFVCVQARAIGLDLLVCTDWCVDTSRSLIEPLFLSSFTYLGHFNAISLCASDDLFRQTGNAFAPGISPFQQLQFTDTQLLPPQRRALKHSGQLTTTWA